RADNLADLICQLLYIMFDKYDEFMQAMLGPRFVDKLVEQLECHAPYPEWKAPLLRVVVNLLAKCEDIVEGGWSTRVASVVTLTPVIAPADPEFETTEENLALPVQEVRKVTDNSSNITAAVSRGTQDACWAFVKRLCNRPLMTHMLNTLNDKSTKTKDMMNDLNKKKPRVGKEIIAYSRVLVHLAKINSPHTRNVIYKFIPSCVRLLFNFKWCTILHNTIHSFLSTIVESPTEEAIRMLLFDTEFIPKTVKVARHCCKVRSETNPQSRRQRQAKHPCGNTWHIMRLAEDLIALASNDSWINEKLQSTKHWDKVARHVDYIQTIRNQDLGGPLPNALTDFGLHIASGNVRVDMSAWDRALFGPYDPEDIDGPNIGALLPKEGDLAFAKTPFGTNVNLAKALHVMSGRYNEPDVVYLLNMEENGFKEEENFALMNGGVEKCKLIASRSLVPLPPTSGGPGITTPPPATTRAATSTTTTPKPAEAVAGGVVREIPRLRDSALDEVRSPPLRVLQAEEPASTEEEGTAGTTGEDEDDSDFLGGTVDIMFVAADLNKLEDADFGDKPAEYHPSGEHSFAMRGRLAVGCECSHTHMEDTWLGLDPYKFSIRQVHVKCPDRVSYKSSEGRAEQATTEIAE
ncbi:hypothetical protein GNI_049970, partial [Gregarina niphandrodes]